MDRGAWQLVGGMAGGTAYAVYSTHTGTGLGGWLEQAQHALFGAAMAKLTFLLTMGASTVLLLLAAEGVARLLGAAPTPAAARAPLPAALDPAAAPARLWPFWLGLLGLFWALLWGLWWWDEHRSAADEQATYRPLDLDTAPAVAEGYLRLSARPLGDQAVARYKGRDAAGQPAVEAMYLPLAGQAWRPGQPVPYVLQLAGERLPPPPWLVQVQGEVPVPVAQHLAQAQAAPGQPGLLLRLVPSHQGQPLVRGGGPAQRLHWPLGASVGAVVFVAVAAGVHALGWRRRQRRLASRP